MRKSTKLKIFRRKKRSVILSVLKRHSLRQHTIEPTLKYLTEAKNGTKMGSSQIVFSGTADQWMEPELLADFCRKHGIEHHAYAGGNHSIETGHVLRDVEIAKEIVGFYEKLL